MRTVKITPGVEWSVERYELLLRKPGGEFDRIGYPQAAIWDLLSRNYDWNETVKMMVHIAGLNAESAEALVAESIQTWKAKGLLI
jgi:hypothetical protein